MTHTTSLANNFEPGISGPTRTLVVSEQVSERAFFGVSVLLFIVSAGMAMLWSNSMSAMRGMPMAGGWTMSMAWMRMPGQTWADATASFVGMWAVMMAAMMLPSLAPMLWRYRQSIGRARETVRDRLTILVGLGYFFVWTLVGLAVFMVGVAAAAIEMEQPALARAVPTAAGLAVLIAGALQFTKWKAHHLTCCREAPRRDCVLPTKADAAWKLGLDFGLHCGRSCANLTAVLLVVGVMDLRAMVAVTAAITAERLAPSGEHVAHAIGFVVVGAGLILIAQVPGLR
jgi:predicted metal-binding membrane protein